MQRKDELRQQALRQLEQFEVLMRNGHFDYGNGFHGRVYLNPHQLFRHPSTIWRLAQDLLEVLPGELLEQNRGRRRSGHGRRAAGAHACRSARRPALADPPAVQLRAVQQRRRSTTSRCAISTRARWPASACCSPTTCGTPGRRSSAARSSCARRAGRSSPRCEICDRMEAITDAGVPNYALAEYKAPENFAAADCPMCKAGEAITSF